MKNTGSSTSTHTTTPGSDMAATTVEIYDTTLRDGTQREGISLSCNDKIRIAQRLDRFGVAIIEGGWPGSNPKDEEFFARARDMEWNNASIAAFGSTCRVGSAPEDDANIHALLDAATPICTLVGKTSLFHVKDVLRTNPDENLRLVEESVAYLVEHGRRVVYDAEHFFDGHGEDSSYALATLAAAARGGAETLVLCDTNGGGLPWMVEEVTRSVRSTFETMIGVHTHNDGGCAVANTLAAVRAGAGQVQGTINGYGERCGNANLCEVVPHLELKMDRRCVPPEKLVELVDLSHFVAEVANLPLDEHMAFVGHSAFVHKGGIHAAAVRRAADSYQHIDPRLVGNQTQFVVSELAGRASLKSKAEELGLSVTDDALFVPVLNRIKELEARGFSFEAAGASVAMMLEREQTDYAPPFELMDYTTLVEHRQGRGMVTEATVKVRVGDEVFHTAGEGNGPVNALDAALRRALSPVYPEINHFHLVDYKVRILDGRSATGAITRVLVDTQNGTQRWSTVGASTNIIEASWLALADSFEYGLVTRPGALEHAPHVDAVVGLTTDGLAHTVERC
jgi:2-isopropylmalate synthase